MSMLSEPLDAIVLAGRGGDSDPLAQATGHAHKALLPLNGRPMLSHVLDALRDSGCVRRIHLVGVGSQELPMQDLLPTTYLPDAGGILENLLSGIASVGDQEMVVICGADVPLLTPAAIRDLVEQCHQQPAGLYYPIVSQGDMERRYPGSGRSFRHFVEGSYCGGDLLVVSPQVIGRNAAFLRRMSSNRKTAWGMVKLMGLGVALRFLCKRLRIRDLEERGATILGCRCIAIVSPYAELAMDVDGPQHLEVVLATLAEARSDQNQEPS